MFHIQKGVLENSHYYCFTPSDATKKYYYYLTWCGHYYCNADYSIQRDYFPYLLLVYVQNGTFNFCANSKHIIAEKGDVILLDCKNPHQYYAGKHLEFIFFHFDGVNSTELTEHLIEQNGAILFKTKYNLQIQSIMNSTFNRFLRKEEISDSERSFLIYNALSCLSYSNEPSNDEDSCITQAIQFIKDNTNRKFSLEELAEFVNLSPYYFSRLFKSKTGHSPMEYAIITRLDIAKNLLRTTNESVKSIGYSLGYTNSTSFINIFSQKERMTPTEFRNMPI